MKGDGQWTSGQRCPLTRRQLGLGLQECLDAANARLGLLQISQLIADLHQRYAQQIGVVDDQEDRADADRTLIIEQRNSVG